MNENIEIRRMKKGDADACFGLMNLVFKHAKPGHPDFQDILPKMTIDDDEHMNKHFGLYRDDKLCAVLGVYPLPVNVGGIKLMSSTVGNVATHPDEEGKGYMTKLLGEAMLELDRIGADMSRLGGKRSRYNRYGYEQSGTNLKYTMTAEQAKPYAGKGVEFRRVEKFDTDLIHKMENLFYQNKIAVDRSDEEGFFLSLLAWQNIPWAAFDREGSFIGYLSASAAGFSIAEAAAKSDEQLRDMLSAWCGKCGGSISFSLSMWQIETTALMDEICGGHTASFPSQFYIRNWDKVCDAFVKLKASYTDMPKAECVVGIEEWGNLRFYCENGIAGAEKTDKSPSVILNRLDATRYIFGPNPHTEEGPDAPGADVFFPLPLSWNLQDRI